MLKEIFEQPKHGTGRDEGPSQPGRLHREVAALNMTAPNCATSGACSHRLRHRSACGRVGEYLIERLANIPTEVEFASECSSSQYAMTPEDMVFASAERGNCGHARSIA